MRKQQAGNKSGIPFRSMAKRFFHIFIAAIFLFGLLLVRDMVKADVKINGHAADNNAAELIPGALATVPETGDIIDGGKDVRINATTVSIIANAGPTYSESELPQASPTIDESNLGYQRDSNDEYNESPDSQVEYRYIVHYVDREVVKEVLVEKPVTLRQFASLEELKAWLAGDDTNEYVHLFAGKNGIVQASDRYDCDDYALQLQQRAANSGFLISVTIIQQQGKPHMINLACIDNDIFYIEPQSDEVWFYCSRD